MNDPYDLQRFLTAQDPIYAKVCAELRAGFKRCHWMWFIFPQIKGLGSSSLSIKFAIPSRKEAEAYLAHPKLGFRLQECSRLVINCRQSRIEEIFRHPDNLKFWSCMTLFARIEPHERVFDDALKKYYDGELDPLTLEQFGQF